MAALGIGVNDAAEYLRSVGYVATPERGTVSDLVEWSARPVM